MTTIAPTPLQTLATNCGGEWPTIFRAAADAVDVRRNFADEASSRSLVPADTSLVVFGSLARGEWTRKSDLDWTLLVDGEVHGDHADVARGIGQLAVDLKYVEPGPTRTFGGLTFSHDLVHLIGGAEDTNANTTRRVLLLLESASLGDDDVRRRVLKALLDRYVGEDLLYHDPASYFVPRFLLNDIARYWRTMTVDSAQKRRDRVDGWALRNIKLRFSRKLIFAAGFWSCLRCHLDPSPELVEARRKGDGAALRDATTGLLFQSCERSPLETLATAFLKYNALGPARVAFDAYEAFLAVLDSDPARQRLKGLDASKASAEDLFRGARKLAGDFQDGLSKLFFEGDDELKRDAQSYGVF